MESAFLPDANGVCVLTGRQWSLRSYRTPMESAFLPDANGVCVLTGRQWSLRSYRTPMESAFLPDANESAFLPDANGVCVLTGRQWSLRSYRTLMESAFLPDANGVCVLTGRQWSLRSYRTPMSLRSYRTPMESAFLPAMPSINRPREPILTPASNLARPSEPSGSSARPPNACGVTEVRSGQVSSAPDRRSSSDLQREGRVVCDVKSGQQIFCVEAG